RPTALAPRLRGVPARGGPARAPPHRHDARRARGAADGRRLDDPFLELDGIGTAQYRARSCPWALGRSQAVRQRVLIPSYAGSNPAAPAIAPVEFLDRHEDDERMVC